MVQKGIGRLAIVALVVGFASGCAVFQEQITKSASKVADGVDAYCENVNKAAREEFRGKVNPTPGGANVTVTCPGD